MAMSERGLTKLMEECGEVIQVAAKLIAYPSGVHPDGGKDLYLRLEEELADLAASSYFVNEKLVLNSTTIHERAKKKLEMFRKWDEENN